MKFLFLIILMLSFVTLAFAKRDIDFSKFNDAMNDHIETVIENNPQMYESQNPGRMPASVSPQGQALKEQQEQIEEKMIDIQDQSLGNPGI